MAKEKKFDWLKDRISKKDSGVIIFSDRIHEAELTKPIEEITDEDCKKSVVAFMRKYIEPNSIYPFQEKLIKEIIDNPSNKDLIVNHSRGKIY